MKPEPITDAMWSLLTVLDDTGHGDRRSVTTEGCSRAQLDAERRCYDEGLTERNTFDSRLVRISEAGRELMARRRATSAGAVA